MYCKNCGHEIPDDANFCPECGYDNRSVGATFTPKNSSSNVFSYGTSRFSRGIATLLCCIGFIAISGVHRFYVGKIGTGVLWLLTGGCFGIGTIVDLIMLITGDFTDKDTNKFKNWSFD